MAYLYKQPRECECGYITLNRGNWGQHRKTCKHVAEAKVKQENNESMMQVLQTQVSSLSEQMREREMTFKEQLAAKDEQLAAKDRQIEELLAAAKDERKRPRTQTTYNPTNHTNHTNNNYAIANLNAYGKESMDHIPPEKLQELIKEPDTSLARLVALKHSIPENKNVRVPNKRERMVERVMQMADGEKKWEGEDKDKVASDLVESTATVLEEAVDKTTGVGQRYERWVGRLMQSHDEYHLGDSAGKAGGKQFKQQMDLMHHTLVGITRPG